MNKEFLKELLESCSPSGLEIDATRVWNRYCSNIPGLRHIYTDKIGNSGWSIGSGPRKILLSGHLDEICIGVTSITEDGYLIPSQMAGFDRKTLPGSSVLVLNSSENFIEGICQTLPIHLQKEENEFDTPVDFHKIRIDIGCESKEEVLKMGIDVGSLIVSSRNINLNFGQHRLYGNALDDKIGVFCIYEVLNKLGKQYYKNIDNNIIDEFFNKYTIIGVAATQEESGLRGMMVAAHNINADISIDLDVTHACNGDIVDKNKYGEIKLSKGTVIEYGQDKSRRIANIMTDISKKFEIPIQKSLSSCGGTNTDIIQLSSKDCETMLLSLPLMSMHTPCETMDWRDIESTIDLLYYTILHGNL